VRRQKIYFARRGENILTISNGLKEASPNHQQNCRAAALSGDSLIP
jgi:hypothetical protein